jgi:hypothetical protein
MPALTQNLTMKASEFYATNFCSKFRRSLTAVCFLMMMMVMMMMMMMMMMMVVAQMKRLRV